MTRSLLVSLVLLAATVHAQDAIDARLLWRSGEIGDGVVLGNVVELAPFVGGVVVVQSSGLELDVVSIDADGTTSTVVDVAGEAPGHVNRPGSVDMSRDGTTLAVTSKIRTRTTLRRPVLPPFDVTETIEPVFDSPGIAMGQGQRLVDGALLTYVAQQPAAAIEMRVTRLLRHDLTTGEAIVLHEFRGEASTGLDSPQLFAWDATTDGVAFLAEDYHSGSIVAYEADGSQRFRTDVPVEIRRVRDEVIENNRKKFEAMRGKIPDSAIPKVVETFPAIVDLCARTDDGRLRVLSAAGVGRGSEEPLARVVWWVVDTATGEVLSQEALELPGGQWGFEAIVWFRNRIYFAGTDESSDGVPEVLCFETDA